MIKLQSSHFSSPTPKVELLVPATINQNDRGSGDFTSGIQTVNNPEKGEKHLPTFAEFRVPANMVEHNLIVSNLMTGGPSNRKLNR